MTTLAAGASSSLPAAHKLPSTLDTLPAPLAATAPPTHFRAGTLGSPSSLRPCKRGPRMGQPGGASASELLAASCSTSKPWGP